jgi:hypothetical protein
MESPAGVMLFAIETIPEGNPDQGYEQGVHLQIAMSAKVLGFVKSNSVASATSRKTKCKSLCSLAACSVSEWGSLH